MDHQYHSYIFFGVTSKWRESAEKEREDARRELLRAIKSTKDVCIHSYSTLGFRADSAFMLWISAKTPELIQEAVSALLQSDAGKYLQISYTLFGIKRKSVYDSRPTEENISIAGKALYLVIYPFTKTKEWHLLPFEERKKMMGGHIAIGKKYPQIKQLLLYSFGVDNHEFIVSYETESLEEFQSLVMELRGDEVRKYTENDKPIFVCIRRNVKEVIDLL
jgi:chlorite dismutase